MKIKYLGPMDKVNVPPYGDHVKGTVRDYPDEFASDLLATNRRQQFVLEEETSSTKKKDK